MNKFLIDPLILEKRGAIPGLIAELSYRDEKKALEYMRVWGEKKMPISPLFEVLNKELQKVGVVQ